MDAEIADALRAQMEEMGCQVLTSDDVVALDNSDLRSIDVQLDSGNHLQVATILISAGRNGNTAALGLDKVGLGVGKRGHIPVNEHYQTAVAHIYAAGDVIGNPALASTSMDQARVAMVHAFGLHYREGMPRILPYGIYTIPECSMAGETEESLREKNIPYVEGKAYYSGNARGQIIGDSKGFLKLLFHEESMKLLGVHMIGEQATELIHIGLTALILGADADVFLESCYNYPSLSETYKYATYDALGQKARRQRQRAAAARGE
jgi:NAD(P) transhydrogenase